MGLNCAERRLEARSVPVNVKDEWYDSSRLRYALSRRWVGGESAILVSVSITQALIDASATASEQASKQANDPSPRSFGQGPDEVCTVCSSLVVVYISTRSSRSQRLISDPLSPLSFRFSKHLEFKSRILKLK